MSIYEYDKEFEEKKLRKAEYEAGRQDGIEIGRQDGIEIGKRILLEKIIKKKLKKRKPTPLKEPVHKQITPVLIRRDTTE